MHNKTSTGLIIGDIILAEDFAPDFQTLQLNNSIYVIVHKNGNYINQITMYNESSGEITLHSLNKEYADFKVHLSDVKEIKKVIEIVERCKKR